MGRSSVTVRLTPCQSAMAVAKLDKTFQVRRIVVGRGGAAVGEIGVSARKDLEAALSKTVHLMLNVKVAKKGRA